MVRKRIKVFLAALVGAVALAGAGMIYAQGRDSAQAGMGGMMGMMEGMEACPMMGMMAQGPQAALDHREELGLTEAQVQDLETLDAAAASARAPAMEEMRELHREMRDAADGDGFDEAAVRATLGRMGDLHEDMTVAMLRTRQEVRDVLTPEQRQTFAELGDTMMDRHRRMMEMMAMMGDMMGGAMNMENCPMMQGGMDAAPAR